MRGASHAVRFLAFVAVHIAGLGIYVLVVWPMTAFGEYSGGSGASPYAGLSAFMVFAVFEPTAYALVQDLKALRGKGRLVRHFVSGCVSWFIAALMAFGPYYYSAPFAVVGDAVVMATIGALSGAAYWLLTRGQRLLGPKT